MNQNKFTFKDLIVWQRSKDLTVFIYRHFSELRDYGFKDQITRSSLSIPSNIAEGFDRKGNKEFIQFLFIARASCSELETQIIIGKEIGYIEPTIAEKCLMELEEIEKMLFSLILSVQKKSNNSELGTLNS